MALHYSAAEPADSTLSCGAIEILASEVAEIVCLNIRSGPSFAVADAYENLYDLTDEAIKIVENAENL